ncbi:hypothetical protein M3J09_004067 [Ascochyta lentis]
MFGTTAAPSEKTVKGSRAPSVRRANLTAQPPHHRITSSPTKSRIAGQSTTASPRLFSPLANRVTSRICRLCTTFHPPKARCQLH